jgi:hypothetical protein
MNHRGSGLRVQRSGSAHVQRSRYVSATESLKPSSSPDFPCHQSTNSTPPSKDGQRRCYKCPMVLISDVYRSQWCVHSLKSLGKTASECGTQLQVAPNVQRPLASNHRHWEDPHVFCFSLNTWVCTQDRVDVHPLIW